MSDSEPSMFPRERRPASRRFPTVPVLLGAIALIVVAGLGAKTLLDRNERQSYAQAQSIGQAYFSALAADAKRYQTDFDNLVLEDPHRGMDFAWNRQQLANMRAQMSRYRALTAQRGQTARAAIVALKVRPGVRSRYLVEVDKTLADKGAVLERRLANQEAMLTELSAMWDILAGHPGQWTTSAYGGVAITNSAIFPGYAKHAQAYRRFQEDDEALGDLLLAPELWVSAPP